MGKLNHWRASRNTHTLGKFCDPEKYCPNCDIELVCEEDQEKVLYVCPMCDYASGEDKEE